MDKPRCPIDGAPMHRDERPVTLSYRGLEETVILPGWYCSECGESVHNGEEMKISDRALRNLKAKDSGVFLPETIRAIRTHLKLSQVRASELIGGGPRSFQKYESGEIAPSQAICRMLYLLAKHPEMIQELQALHSFSDISDEELFATG